jgi:hypothetical protein
MKNRMVLNSRIQIFLVIILSSCDFYYNKSNDAEDIKSIDKMTLELHKKTLNGEDISEYFNDWDEESLVSFRTNWGNFCNHLDTIISGGRVLESKFTNGLEETHGVFRYHVVCNEGDTIQIELNIYGKYGDMKISKYYTID